MSENWDAIFRDKERRAYLLNKSKNQVKQQKLIDGEVRKQMPNVLHRILTSDCQIERQK